MSEAIVRDDGSYVSIGDLRQGERVVVSYTSSQSRNEVEREGIVSDVDRQGSRTYSFILKADNGSKYDIRRDGFVYSTGKKERKLSSTKVEIFRLEELDIESWIEKTEFGAIQIHREKSEEFDCPMCGAKRRAAVKAMGVYGISRSGDGVKITCGNCRRERTIPDQPLSVVLKVSR